MKRRERWGRERKRWSGDLGKYRRRIGWIWVKKVEENIR